VFNILVLLNIYHKDSLQHPNSKINPHQLLLSEATFKKRVKQEDLIYNKKPLIHILKTKPCTFVQCLYLNSNDL